MKPTLLNLVYFSATGTTKKLAKRMAGELDPEAVREYDITQNVPESEIKIEAGELLVAAVPVYAGRVPALAAQSLRCFRGEGTPAVILCVYGNRDYDDALLELKDMVTGNGFRVISAAAFIARHSIFPAVAADRPDSSDESVAREFAGRSAEILTLLEPGQPVPEISVKGNCPYKTPGKIPFHPTGNNRCNACGTCVKRCPVQAIPTDKPKKTDGSRCIACGRCIVVCPQQARRFTGLLYKAVNRKFVSGYSVRREPECFFAE